MRLLILFLLFVNTLNAANIYIEAESFTKKGGWVVDQQFMDQMGSSYLMAHGLGRKVANAETDINIPESGKYYVYVRTYNWTSPWSDSEGPGKFKLILGNKELSEILGSKGNAWFWQFVGEIKLKKGKQNIELKDLTGFNGRCDAIFMTTEKGLIPPSEIKQLEVFRRKEMGFPERPQNAGEFDLVVVGGGIAGISAAVSAARLGCKVALVNDRPILGGCNSSEIRVHLGGRIEVGTYKALGNLQKEFGHTKEGNAQPAENYEDYKKADIVANEKNITLFSNYRVYKVIMGASKIRSVIARNIETNEDIELFSTLFSDCTGDATVGYLAGADFRMGREAKSEFGESIAPEVADSMTMGASVQWYSIKVEKECKFPCFSYGVEFNEENSEKVTMGEWTWETGMNYNQITDFERIRDYGLMVVYSNWSFLKNKYSKKEDYKYRKLDWVAYVAGKRESRRLMGDYILKEDDLVKRVFHEDASFTTSWTIDLHYPDPENTKNFPGNEFKSICKHIPIHLYSVPYRCLYSRNIDNLFMAGRNISVTHVALGTVRVMRTTGQMGEVVGMAAKICKDYDVNPRDIYQRFLPELRELMEKGVGKTGLKNNQKFNMGSTLSE